ncbi:MAG: rod shape-determining protein MreC [Pelagibacteraceae bacterium]|jgi:rod shape-determining protein MreC|nr:rod shape-determining protein MreC [Pelagibacteraceae bacterium]
MSTSRDDFGIAIRSALLQRGAKQKFSLFVLILLSLSIFVLDVSKLKPIKIFRSLLNDGIYRISAISSSPIKFSGTVKDFFITHIFVYKENLKLKTELEELKNKDLQTSYLQTANKRLQDIIQLEKKSTFTTVAAKVLLDKNSPYLNSVIINRGSNSGIKLGMPVLSEGNLVGRVVEVNFFSARILLLNDLNSKIPVMISPKGSQAILSGRGEDKPKLEYLPEKFELNDKNLVFTSGKDGIFFEGIPIGNVIFEDNKIKVKLFSDPNQVSFVNVILDKSSDAEAM